MPYASEVPTYRYELVHGHVIVVAGDARLLIDTGSPRSVGTVAPLADLPTFPPLLGATPRSISASVGTRVDGLVGTDLLNRHDVHIDPPTASFTLSEEELPPIAFPIAVDLVEGVPTIPARIGALPVRLVVDTGAWLSYLEPRWTAGAEPLGAAVDFHPTLGRFETATWAVPVQVGTAGLTLRAGHLPRSLTALLSSYGAGGILGTEVLRGHGLIYAPRRRQLALCPFPHDRREA